MDDKKIGDVRLLVSVFFLVCVLIFKWPGFESDKFRGLV